MLLRLKHRSGQRVISNLTVDSTVAELLSAVHSALPQTVDQCVSLKVGYPPKVVDTLSQECLEKSLKQASITDGETIIVEDKPRAKPIVEMSESLLEQLTESPADAGFMVRQTIPSDNSCLFTAVHFCLTGVLDTTNAPSMRELVASIVMSDPVTYNEALLDMPNPAYAQWILDPDHWGGGIEVALLSRAYGIEIAVVDTQTTRVDRFGETEKYSEQIILLYDGIHYDSLAWVTARTGNMKTRFPTDNDKMIMKALELAHEAKQNRQFTDTTRFTLQCNDCGKKLTGSKEAQAHAGETGHFHFGET